MNSDDDQSDDNGNDGLKSIPTSRWSRAAHLTKLTASVGASALGSRFAQTFTDKALQEGKYRLHQIRQAKKIVETLSKMKGAAMKLGQVLSMHGDTLFPKEVTEILSRLQANSEFISFSEIEKVIIGELGSDYKTRLLDFSKRPIASASIGQVHKACLEDGTWVAVKVQYPGVEESIDSDVDSLASLLRLVAKLPSGESFEEVIDEVKEVLHLETDYLEEGANSQFFYDFFKNDPTVVVPHYYPELSTKRILTTQFVKGLTVQKYRDGPYPEEHRAHIGATFMRVFYQELFLLGVVQTDPNFGNYKIMADERKLLLLDFGAVKKFSGAWRQNYIEMIRAAYAFDRKKVVDYSCELGFLRPDDSDECKNMQVQLCEMFLEPFRENKLYAFHESDLPNRMRVMIPQIISAFKLRAPPRHIIFLNRKMVGTYLFLAAIKARINPRPLLEEFLNI